MALANSIQVYTRPEATLTGYHGVSVAKKIAVIEQPAMIVLREAAGVIQRNYLKIRPAQCSRKLRLAIPGWRVTHFVIIPPPRSVNCAGSGSHREP